MRENGEIRWVPLSGLQADILAAVAELLAGKDVPEGIVYLVGSIPRLWDEAAP